MKKHIVIYILTTFITISLSAQNEYEALLFSQYVPNGTARYTAMGGAFGALGADLSVMATNPAGTGMYRKSEVGISTAWTNHRVDAEFNGRTSSANNMSFQLANLGFVTVNNTTSSDWKKVNVGFSYNHLNDYNRSYVVNGANNKSSMLDLQAHFLDVNERDTSNNAYYLANLLFKQDGKYLNDYSLYGAYGAEQSHKVRTSGYAGEYDLNISSSYRDFMFVGATLGFQRLKYSSYVEHSEHPFNDELSLLDFESIDRLNAKGSGFNVKLGMLFKISHLLRLGAAFHSPTLYNVRYDYWTDAYATLDFGDGTFGTEGLSPKGAYNWSFSSPAKYIASGAVVIGRLAIISAELEYLNYTKSP